MKKDDFFDRIDQLGLALTYDDVRLKSDFSNVSPRDVLLQTHFSRNISLMMPVVSAAMDTVTESKMAIALAMAGGIGVIHRGLSPKEQAKEVARTKFYLNGLIERPICISPGTTVAEVLEMREKKGYSFQSFPVVDEYGIIRGVVSRNDFDYAINPNVPVSTIMSKEVVAAREGTTLEEAYEIMVSNKKKMLPLADHNSVIKGLYVFKDVKRLTNSESSQYTTDGRGRLRVAAAIGTNIDDNVIRIPLLVAEGVDALVIDTAHGDSAPVLETLKMVKRKFPTIDVVVGNVSEPDSAKRLYEAGADGVKVGQGPGSICTTRIVAGIGCPQVTAVYQCAKALRGTGVPVIADGGIKNSGDIAIAIAAGASSVMLGKVLAGATESPGKLSLMQGVRMKSYRGMGSIGAMKDSKAARERYRQGDNSGDKLVPEGIEGAVPYIGDVKEVLHQYIGGLRSGMGYVGGRNIQDFQEKANFHRISNAGLNESHTHDVVMTKEPPNYSRD